MKKPLLILLALVILCLCACTKYVVMGDVNKDGKLSITDYTLIRLDKNGLKKLDDRKSGDVNNDNVIDEKDYDIVRYIITR